MELSSENAVKHLEAQQANLWRDDTLECNTGLLNEGMRYKNKIQM